MSAIARHRRVDTDRLRAFVPAVLRLLGVDAPRDRGRCRGICHDGENPTSLSYTETQWFCHRCGRGGDALALVMAVRKCGFREALAVVAELAGVPVDGLPRIDRAEIQRREKITRRREALRRWRHERLRQFNCLIATLTRDADLLGAYYAAPDHQDDPDRWRLLGSLHEDLGRAEYMAALLSTEEETKWAELWLAEQRGDLLTPEDLA